jgi:peptide/nickel transport system ATP-binding protein
MSENILEIEHLNIDFFTKQGTVRAVNNSSFKIPRGKTVGLVGESGSGKSVTALAIMGLIPNPPGKITGGRINYNGKDLVHLSDRQMREIRGNHISMIFQEPMTSLNPVFRVGDQIMESLQLHRKMSKAEAKEKALELMDQVGIPTPNIKFNSYPHELSGGQKQRIMIAMAISCEPDLLICDEPTTALDVTIQKQVLELMLSLQESYKMSMLFITHDLAVVSELADDIVVMYKSNIVEKNNTRNIFSNPAHPYSRGLISCRPKLSENPKRLLTVSDFMDEDGNEITNINRSSERKQIKTENPADETILEVKGLKKYFPIKGGIFRKTIDYVRAVDDVSFTLKKGRTLGLVGESGCGKTTLGRSILRLIEPTEGHIAFHGKEIINYDANQLRQLRKNIQIIFQDPYSSLNPRMNIGSILTEPMEIHQIEKNQKNRLEKAADLLVKVGLEGDHLSRYPHEFSGGQRQRICIARALSLDPEFIVCDESVSALDVSVQAQVLNLLLDLQEELNLTYIFISHDLSVVNFISDDVGVMSNGKIIEMGSANDIYNHAKDPYTIRLLDSIPKGISL